MKRYLSTFILISTVLLLRAQEGTLRLTVNRNTLGMEDLLQVSYSLSGKGSKWKLPSFPDWTVVSGPNVSTSFQSINGVTSQTTTYTYLLQPTKSGKFTIPAAGVEVDGKMVSSNTVEVTVGGSGGSQQTKKENEDIFIRVMVDKSRALAGEQITLTYKIYTRIPVRSYNLTKVPSWAGFWAQDLDMPQQISLSPENVNGITYQTGILRRQALFAQKPGSFSFEPVEMDAIVRQQVRSYDPFFDDPFFGMSRDVQVKLKSNALSLTITPFATPAPAGFSGISGKLNLSSNLSAEKTKANEPVTFKITVSGEGNIKMIPDFKLKLPAEIETYDPKVTEKTTTDGGKVSGTKTYEYLLIPRNKGNYRIDPQTIIYYNTAQQRFVTLSTPEYNLTVEKGEDNAISGQVIADKKDVDLLTRDLRYIKLEPLNNIGRNKNAENKSMLIWAVLPLILGGGAFAYRRYQIKQAAGGAALRQTRAAATARKRLRKAAKWKDAGDKGNFYMEISAAIWEYLRDKLKMQNADLTREIVEENLKNSTGREHITTLWAVLDECELARYAPAAPGLDMQSAYVHAAAAIQKMEEVK